MHRMSSTTSSHGPPRRRVHPRLVAAPAKQRRAPRAPRPHARAGPAPAHDRGRRPASSDVGPCRGARDRAALGDHHGRGARGGGLRRYGCPIPTTAARCSSRSPRMPGRVVLADPGRPLRRGRRGLRRPGCRRTARPSSSSSIASTPPHGRRADDPRRRHGNGATVVASRRERPQRRSSRRGS